MNTRWEVSILGLENSIGKRFKVTRRIPEYRVAETKIFASREEAQKQVDEWLENMT